MLSLSDAMLDDMIEPNWLVRILTRLQDHVSYIHVYIYFSSKDYKNMFSSAPSTDPLGRKEVAEQPFRPTLLGDC